MADAQRYVVQEYRSFGYGHVYYVFERIDNAYYVVPGTYYHTNREEAQARADELNREVEA